jgi:acyl carrier protein
VRRGVPRQSRRGVGPLGLREEVEPIVRRLVAEHLGVPATALRSEVSFAQDLAATPADVTELIVAAERMLGTCVEGDVVERAGTYGDLVDAIVDARLQEEEATLPRVWFRSVLVPARRGPLGVVVRSLWSTPYEIETVLQEAHRAGPGTCLVVALAPTTPARVLAHLEGCFAPLAARGITVRVRAEWPVRARAVA